MMANPLVKRTLSLAAYVIIAAVIAYLISDRHLPTLAVGTVAPMDEKIVRFDGSTTTFRRMLTKPMLINFWASWCPACLKELPTLGKISQRFRGKVIFIGAALNSDGNEVMALKQQFALNFEMLAINDALADLWQARVLPTTYILDTGGKVIWAKTGVAREEELAHAIEAVLKK